MKDWSNIWGGGKKLTASFSAPSNDLLRKESILFVWVKEISQCRDEMQASEKFPLTKQKACGIIRLTVKLNVKGGGTYGITANPPGTG